VPDLEGERDDSSPPRPHAGPERRPSAGKRRRCLGASTRVRLAAAALASVRYETEPLESHCGPACSNQSQHRHRQQHAKRTENERATQHRMASTLNLDPDKSAGGGRKVCSCRGPNIGTRLASCRRSILVRSDVPADESVCTSKGARYRRRLDHGAARPDGDRRRQAGQSGAQTHPLLMASAGYGAA
jgi:hypothetical protein